MTKQDAIKRLTNRYHEQLDKFPLMARHISVDLYIRRNLPTVMANAKSNLANGLPEPLMSYDTI